MVCVWYEWVLFVVGGNDECREGEKKGFWQHPDVPVCDAIYLADFKIWIHIHTKHIAAWLHH